MEIEEASLNLPPDVIPPENALPPASARISYFFIDPQPVVEDYVYGITFLTKQNGTDAGWHFRKEHIRLRSTSIGNEGVSPRLRQVMYSLDDNPFNRSKAK
jgi:hypothetical protein